MRLVASRPLGLAVAVVVLAAFVAAPAHHHDLPGPSSSRAGVHSAQKTIDCSLCALLKNVPTSVGAAAQILSPQPIACHHAPSTTRVPTTERVEHYLGRAPPSLLG